MSSASDIFRGGSVYEQLINQIITLESRKKFSFEDQIETQQTRKASISTVGTKLTAFNSLLKDYVDPFQSTFNTLSPQSSNTDAFSVSNSGTLSSQGTFNFEIQQLAKNDVKVSSRFDTTTNNIATAATGSLDFDVTLGSGPATTVSVDLTGVTDDDQAIQRVATAINDANIEGVQASVLRETSGSVRLSIRTAETGVDNQIQISSTGNANDIAEIIELTSGGADNTTIVGATTSGGRLFAASDLDAQFTIDGLNFSRSNNEVTDAIAGLTINLKKVTTGVETITIGQDTAAARSAVDGFISSFNDVNSEIRSQSFLNGQSGDRGPLYGDRSFRDLTFTLRQRLLESVELDGGDKISIFDIGLDLRNNGELFVSDATKLETALSERAADVEALFANDVGNDELNNGGAKEGLAVRLSADMNTFISSNGLVNSTSTSIDDRITDLNARITREDEFLERRREILRDQFARLEALSNSAQSQFQTIQAISGGFF